jgi:predicted metal-dependent peptidase
MILDKHDSEVEQVSQQEFLSISNSLEKYHGIFYAFWNIGKPLLTNKVDTCCICFDNEGRALEFRFNPNLWKTKTPTEREFLICHEILHIVLEHGRRIKKESEEIDNLAADIVVNHLLVKSFNFNRKDISFADNLCWTDTIFPDEKNLSTDSSFEFYFNLINNEIKKESLTQFQINIADDHNGFCGKGLPQDFIDKINKTLSDEEKQQLANKLEKQINPDNINRQAGTDSGDHWLTVLVTKPKKKKKWESVIKKWVCTKTNAITRDTDQWARLSRRFSLISKDFFIPSEMEVEDVNYGKLNVWFFQDTSGSCSHLAQRFFTAALTIPEDKFDVRLFCFDTKVYEVDKTEKKLYGFGGTSFGVLENYIQKKIKLEKIKYPSAIFVITDGYGDFIVPQYQEKWYWFLSSNYDCYIPKRSNKFMLKDFE